MTRKQRSPEEIERRAKIRELLQASNISSVENILTACTNNLTGFSAAIEAVFPKTEIQNCIIYQIRNATKYVFHKDLKASVADIKAVYTAVDEPAARESLALFAQWWNRKYPKISVSWQEN